MINVWSIPWQSYHWVSAKICYSSALAMELHLSCTTQSIRWLAGRPCLFKYKPSQNMLNIQEIMHTAYIFVLFCGYVLTHFTYITYSPAQSFDCLSVSAKQPRRIWGNMSHPLTHRGLVDLWKWAIFNTILMSPKSWLSQEDLAAGCEHSLVPMDS